MTGETFTIKSHPFPSILQYSPLPPITPPEMEFKGFGFIYFQIVPLESIITPLSWLVLYLTNWNGLDSSKEMRSSDKEN